MNNQLYVMQWRISRRWNQTELAALCKTTATTISRIERDVYSPGGRVLVRLAAAFGCQVPDLYRQPSSNP